MAVETAVQFLPAMVVIAVLGAHGSAVFGTKWDTSVLLALSGVITVVPLLCFATGTRLLPLSVIGLLQFLTPVLQFAVGVGIRHEELPTAELVGFCLVWVALIVLSADGLRAQHGTRRAARAAREEAVAA
jgi:chloramphenicol-sensitive protein RarD